MKKKFEIPEMEVFFVEVKDQIMGPNQCNGYDCPDGICMVDGVCLTDGICPPDFS